MADGTIGAGQFVLGITELALWVQDLDVAVEFYRDRLGFEVTDYTSGASNAFLRSHGLVLGLFLPVAEGNSVLAQEYLSRYGGPRGPVYHVGFHIAPDELDRRAVQIRDQGVEVKGPIKFDNGRRSYFLEDLDGHYIELTDR